MGYGFSCRYRKNDDEPVFYSECQYAYESIFKSAFGIKVQSLTGRVTKDKLRIFKEALIDLKENRNDYEEKIVSFRGNISNRSYDGVLSDFEEIITLMEEKKIGYISIG